jgi:4'-phosphopantetheinyl transferase
VKATTRRGSGSRLSEGRRRLLEGGLRLLDDTGRVHVWVVSLDAPEATAAVLSEEERVRAARFVSEALRQRYVAAHAALRGILSAYVGEEPAELRLTRLPGGKPRLGSGRLSFNLAHSGGLALVAVTEDADIGVDVERVRPLDIARVGGFVCADAETARLEALDADSALRAFFRLWTAKEALLKARGTGISVRPSTLDLSGILERSEIVYENHAIRALDPEHGYAAAVALRLRP